MKISDCCGIAGRIEQVQSGICPECHEHCEYNEEFPCGECENYSPSDDRRGWGACLIIHNDQCEPMRIPEDAEGCRHWEERRVADCHSPVADMVKE